MLWMLESNCGWKVVLSWSKPVGGEESKCRNWTLIQDGLKWDDARKFVLRWNG